MMAVGNHDYKFTGVKTVNVYSIPVVAMNDYTRTGANRYGTPEDLGTEVQALTITKDRSWTFVIDRGDKIQSQMVLDAGKAVSRQTREVIIPEFDAYVFNTIAKAAFDNGNTSATAATKSNAYELFLNAQETLGNKNVPDKGRICFCSYKYANLLKQDPAFMRYGNQSQEMLIKGVMGEVDGVKIVKVPASRLPEGASFILTHPIATVAPKQLEDYKIHDNPPGINGWLAEGRFIYDCFVLNNKADAIFYHGNALA
jgi:N4-gp56 family major capsid protein